MFKSKIFYRKILYTKLDSQTHPRKNGKDMSIQKPGISQKIMYLKMSQQQFSLCTSQKVSFCLPHTAGPPQ